MNGYEHYRRAEELLDESNEPGVVHTVTGERLTYKHNDAERGHMIASSHVHALLALSAATADATAFQRSLYEANGLEIPEKEARKRRTADRNADAANDYL
ncbi:hypothetical protein PV729_26790 [Streptomyces europaeiscabiei]|uniref:Uncharacterized protein n=1 Tax=Streptomyces europaeiscabiei TaxID=146819 RepID=A0ABU4NSL2_9ACTN|nr:hypothetical protein [Streptomyces europaeiscabiei]MDX3555330.1 hypothetical protein [Streptomyces europaeiscabiei]MDX3705344.1 hypothetical protein [Streptomyces europaeiscabiei]